MRVPVLFVPAAASRVVLVCVAMAVLLGSGCSWFRKDDPVYRQSAENRPLEVPPDLDLPNSQAVPAASVTASTLTAQAAAANGFTVAGTQEAVFEQVGQALAGIEGVTVTSRARGLGVYDVGYAGGNFLVRVSAAADGALVSAVDARGLPASGAGPDQVLAALKAALAK